MQKKARILLDCTSAAKEKRGGIQNYVTNLVNALRQYEDRFAISVTIRVSHLRSRDYLKDIAPEGAKILFPFSLRGKTILHALGARLPVVRAGLKTVATIHDVGVFDVPDLYSQRWVKRRRQRIRQTVKRANALVVPAPYTAIRIRQLFPFFRGPIEITPEGVDHNRFKAVPSEEDEEVLQSLELRRPFILQVGVLSPRKDPLTSLRGFALCEAAKDFELLYVGSGKKAYLEDLKKEASKLGISERVRFLGFLSSSSLPSLYRRCSAFVFPSRYEGFGLPVLEAMACGAVLLLSDAPCHRDVAGPAARYFKPGDSESLAGALAELLQSRSEREKLQGEALSRSRDFTWEKTAALTVKLYSELL